MKLKEVFISNFKSIKNLKLLFSDNIYGLVGQNEIGKSNILQAIHLLKVSHGFIPVDDKFDILLSKASIEATFELEKADIAALSSISSEIAANGTSYNTRSITSLKIIVRKYHDRPNQFFLCLDIVNMVFDINNITNPDLKVKVLNKILQIFPSIEYFENEDFLLKPFNLKDYLLDKTNVSYQAFERLFKLGGIKDFEKLSGLPVADLIQERENATEKINDLLAQYYKSNYDLKIKIESHDGIFSLHFKDKYSRLNVLEERSTGFKYFFSFLINKLYLQQFGKKNSIYLLDEPALSLHPTNQKKFIALLEDVAAENLILYTTHSPFSINRMKPTRIWVVERDITREHI